MTPTIASIAALVAASALSSSPAQADTRTATPTGARVAVTNPTIRSLALPDRQFVVKAAQGGNAEINLGRLALQKSSNAMVKKFAQQMIGDHTTAGTKLASIVTSMGGSGLAPGLSPEDAAARAKLASLSGAAFDAAYLTGQVTGHQKMAALMQKQASTGENAELKAYATATLPTVQAHLSMAQKDAGTVSGAH